MATRTANSPELVQRAIAAMQAGGLSRDEIRAVLNCAPTTYRRHERHLRAAAAALGVDLDAARASRN